MTPGQEGMSLALTEESHDIARSMERGFVDNVSMFGIWRNALVMQL